VLTFASHSEKRVNRGQTGSNPILDNSKRLTSNKFRDSPGIDPQKRPRYEDEGWIMLFATAIGGRFLW